MGTTNKMVLEKYAKELEEDGYEICDMSEKEWNLYDTNYGKEIVIRLFEKNDKRKVISDAIDIGSSDIDKEKLVGLLCLLPEELFQSIKKVLFIKDEEDNENLMAQFDNTDRIDFDDELGKYLFEEDWVIVNLHAIRITASQISFNEDELVYEYNVGIWTTLLHELRHVYQHSPMFEFIEGELNDKEADAEIQGIDMFEKFILPKDFIII